MDTDAVINEILAIAEDRWGACPEELPETLYRGTKGWAGFIEGLQRAHLLLALRRLHVPLRAAVALTWWCPWRLLPRFDPNKWWAERSDH